MSQGTVQSFRENEYCQAFPTVLGFSVFEPRFQQVQKNMRIPSHSLPTH